MKDKILALRNDLASITLQPDLLKYLVIKDSDREMITKVFFIIIQFV